MNPKEKWLNFILGDELDFSGNLLFNSILELESSNIDKSIKTSIMGIALAWERVLKIICSLKNVKYKKTHNLELLTKGIDMFDSLSQIEKLVIAHVSESFANTNVRYANFEEKNIESFKEKKRHETFLVNNFLTTHEFIDLVLKINAKLYKIIFLECDTLGIYTYETLRNSKEAFAFKFPYIEYRVPFEYLCLELFYFLNYNSDDFKEGECVFPPIDFEEEWTKNELISILTKGEVYKISETYYEAMITLTENEISDYASAEEFQIKIKDLLISSSSQRVEWIKSFYYYKFNKNEFQTIL